MELGIDPRNKSLILATLDPIVPLLTEAAEYGAERAKSYFVVQDLAAARVRDRYLFAHMVRHQVCAFLNERGQAASIDRRWLPNSGVAFSRDWLDVRFLKSYFGRLPAPGYSQVKRAFYRQTIEQSLWDQNSPSFQRVNVVITWDVDGLGNLSALDVYSPCGGGVGRDSARWYWHQSLAHPAMTFEPAPDDEYADDEDREDIDEIDRIDRQEKRSEDADQDAAGNR